MKLMTGCLLVFALFLMGHASAAPLTLEQKLQDFDQLVALIRSDYAPLRFKERLLGISLDRLQSSYRAEVLGTSTDEEFFLTVNRFVARFRDTHFRSNAPVNRVATLPFDADLVDGKVVIDVIFPDRLNGQVFPFHRGDEVVSFDGKPIQAVLDELARYSGHGTRLAELHFATYRLTVRSGRLFHVPEGDVVVGIKPRGTDAIQSAKLHWTVQSPTPGFTVKRDGLMAEYRAFCSGETRIPIPAGAVMVTQKPFVSYYHPTPLGNIGYLRIGNYSPTSIGDHEGYERAYRELEAAVSVLEKNTVGLVIDQAHNCGGYLLYVHRVLSLFMTDSFSPQQFEIRASKHVYDSLNEYWFSKLVPGSTERAGAEGTMEAILSSWDRGRYTTRKRSFEGVDEIQPNAVHYTKPILVLIDEMAGSCGDIFPAQLQSNARANLFGVNTMGAGGQIDKKDQLDNSRMEIQVTHSLGYLAGGPTLENRGAQPDFRYTVTIDDYVNGYRDYQAAYLAALGSMIDQAAQ